MQSILVETFNQYISQSSTIVDKDICSELRLNKMNIYILTI